MNHQRGSGILLHISSLPSSYGIGDLGRAAYEFVDFLEKAGQKFWQILPINPTSFGDSPYQALSAFAGNPYFIDPEDLVEKGWIKEAELQGSWGDDPETVDFGTQFTRKTALLKKAYDRFKKKQPADFAAFCERESAWLEDYCLYRAIKAAFRGMSWQDWDSDVKYRKPAALQRYAGELADDVGFHRFTQFCFFTQWEKLRQYAHDRGISIIGDIPIYVPMDSADVWANPENFQLTRTRRPKCVSGCPPDMFSKDGQFWGHPIYDWEKMEQDGFSWWLQRVGCAARLFDVIRIDHFRGIESYWSIPGRNKTAREGQWVPGPGMKLVGKIRETYPDTAFIAEDLGFLTEDVRNMVKDSGFPGMKVLEFAFDEGTKNEYLPHHYIDNCVCYTGTHDNDTLMHWLEDRTEQQWEFLEEYLDIRPGDDARMAVLRAGMESRANWFIAIMQDWLGLGGASRMNEPGVANAANWRWRMLPGAASDALAEQIREMTEDAERL